MTLSLEAAKVSNKREARTLMPLRVASIAVALAMMLPAAAPSQTSSTSSAERPLLLQARDGEVRLRRPRTLGAARVSIAGPSVLVKVDRRNGGATSLMFFTENFRPGAVIPRHRHLRQDEIVFIEHGTVFARIGNVAGNVSDGGTLFIPRNTWVTIKNVGTTDINALSFFSGSDFDQYIRCSTVPPGRARIAMSTAVRKDCASRGGAQYFGL